MFVVGKSNCYIYNHFRHTSSNGISLWQSTSILLLLQKFLLQTLKAVTKAWFLKDCHQQIDKRSLFPPFGVLIICISLEFVLFFVANAAVIVACDRERCRTIKIFGSELVQDMTSLGLYGSRMPEYWENSVNKFFDGTPIQHGLRKAILAIAKACFKNK